MDVTNRLQGRSSSVRAVSFPAVQLADFVVERSDELLVSGKWTMDPAGSDVSQTFRELGVDMASLLGRVFVRRFVLDGHGRSQCRVAGTRSQMGVTPFRCRNLTKKF